MATRLPLGPPYAYTSMPKESLCCLFLLAQESLPDCASAQLSTAVLLWLVGMGAVVRTGPTKPHTCRVEIRPKLARFPVTARPKSGHLVTARHQRHTSQPPLTRHHLTTHHYPCIHDYMIHHHMHIMCIHSVMCMCI